ncbi:hypothetical protein Syun_028122 [Stephania yunnanensis]|uniref:O-methyltransferase domain-containing protein n=1 Tax=Stephania yunnanensis TaxID=152371 RepID=A0AAP0HQU7_9MAGN
MARFERTIMYMVHINLLTQIAHDQDGEINKYGLISTSKLLLKSSNCYNNNKSLAAFVTTMTNPDELFMCGRLVGSLGGSKSCWELCQRKTVYEKMEKDEKWSKSSDGMHDHTINMVQALVDGLRREQVIDRSVKTLIDVGGNTGIASKEIYYVFSRI